MKPAALLILVLAFLAGCTGTESRPEGTGESYAKLSELALDPEEMPEGTYAYLEWDVNRSANLYLSAYNATRAYSRAGWSRGHGASGGEPAQFVQAIIEYPQGNAAPAFALLRNITGHPAEGVLLRWGPDPGIGDESFSILMMNHSAIRPGTGTALVAFRKGQIIEMISLEAEAPDPAAVAGAARRAAAKVP